MDISPHLFAIQSLAGETSSNKYKELNSIATQIIENDEERNDFLKTGTTDRVQPALFPYLRILIGDKLKLSDAVIEALKSNDLYIIKQALRTKWFFNESNPLITVEFLATNLPFMTLRTRLELFKTLARRCLMNDTKKAEEFFKYFVNEYYNYKQAFPLLVACGDDFIIDTILKYGILLPHRVLRLLYFKSPQLVIRYLKLGYKREIEDESEEEEESGYSTPIFLENIEYKNQILVWHSLRRFIPTLIKNNLKDFIEVCKIMCNESHFYIKFEKKLGRRRAEYIFQNGLNFFMENSNLFLRIMQLKFVRNKLGAERLETALKDYFGGNYRYFTIRQHLEFISSHPKEMRLNLLITLYKSIEENSLLNDVNIFYYPEIIRVMPSDVQEKLGRNSVIRDEGEINYHHLPPKFSIPILKLKIKTISNKSPDYWIRCMIESCYIYGDKEALADVLIYYNQQYENKEDGVLDRVLTKLCSKFAVKSLEEKHWVELKNILLKTHIKGEVAINKKVWIQLLEGALEFYLKKYKTTADTEDEKIFESFFSKYLEYYFEKNLVFNFQPECSKIKWNYIHLLLSEVSARYPESSPVWNTDSKLTFTIHVLELLIDLKRCDLDVELKNQYTNEIKNTIFKVESHHWLMKFIQSLIDNKRLVETLRSYDPALCEALIHKKPIAKVTTREALHVLKSNYKAVLDRWQDYLDDCRAFLVKKRQKCTRNFVAATKWYQDLPINFINQCLIEIEKEGSTLVLGVLLEGEILSRMLEPYIPKDEQANLEDKNSENVDYIAPKKKYNITFSLAKSINFFNYPVALEIVRPLCKGSLFTAGQRLLVNIFFEFVKSLISNNISEIKLVMRLALKVGSINELCEIFMLIWSHNKSKDLSIRKMLTKRIYNLFKRFPSEQTFELMKACINDLTGHDYSILIDYACDLEEIDYRFICQAIEVWTKRMDDLIMVETLDVSRRRSLKELVLRELNPEIVLGCPEDVITNIVKQNIFLLPLSITMDTYLFIDEHKFESRLNIIMEVLEKQSKLNELDSNDEDYKDISINLETLTFFRELTSEVKYTNKQMSAKLFDRLLTLFSTSLRLEESPEFFIKFTLFKSYLEAKDAKAFGTKCAKDIQNLVKYFGSDIVFSIIEESMRKMDNIFSNDQHIEESVIVSVMKGLVGFWYVNAIFNVH